ncbi:hypothetical protein I2I11_08330 [Pontibacter sp. 172403-2]|uniref:hypothetical protein n=1 Tax=Pontibacter rufus TaxID=2791028 RepID=UPI0018B00148|nr:hypothetical protein [Pontibacter sp. 172403-2]MBF9253295.1 hypothetical protein [Pontibacter sp. 172403-2]
MHQLKLLLHYHKSLLRFNLPFSLLASLTGCMFPQQVFTGMINGFSLSLLTGGFILALYLFEQRHSNQYYFYYNQSLSKIYLIAASYGMNALLVLLLFTLKLYLYAAQTGS